MDNILFSPIPLPELKEQLRELIRSELQSSGKKNMEPESNEELLNSKQASALLGVSKVTLHKWKGAGKLKAYRIGDVIRYKKSEVIQALQEINIKRK